MNAAERVALGVVCLALGFWAGVLVGLELATR